MARVKETGVLSCEFSVAQYGNLHRLFCGPYDSRQDALDAAADLPADLNIKPIAVKR